MTDLLTPTTKLEAVNWGLKELGFPQVASLSGAIGRDASIVLTSLEEKTRDLCASGLWFARRTLTLTPNGSGYLIPPSNTLTIRRAENDGLSAMVWREDRPTLRQGKVYSIFRQSYVYTQPLTVTIFEALAFEDLPNEVRQHVMVAAALTTNGSIVRSDDVEKKLQPLLNNSWNTVLDSEFENSEHRFI